VISKLAPVAFVLWQAADQTELIRAGTARTRPQLRRTRLGRYREPAQQGLRHRIDAGVRPRFKLALAYIGAKPLGRRSEFDSNHRE
jgi:hypothetical protein